MKSAPSPELGIWLRRVLDHLGVSSNALATAAGIAPGTLRNAETGRHRISRRTAKRLMQEIAKRDAMLAHTAPSPLHEVAPQAQPTDKASLPSSTPLAHLRLQPFGLQVMLQVELDQRAVRQLVSALGDLLTRSQRAPEVILPGLHLVIVEKK